MIKQFPNFLTLMNLACGIAGIVNVFVGDPDNTIYLILLAGGFDFLDGFAARLLKVSGDFGKELDSLADMVTFGVLPSVLMFKIGLEIGHDSWIIHSSFLIGLMSAIRLARFNLQEVKGFIGVPTPANAIMISSFFLLGPIFNEPYVFLAVSIISSILLVVNIPMIALKFEHFGLKGNEEKYIIILFSITLIVLLGMKGLAFLIPVYIILSIVGNITRKLNKS